MFIKNHETLAAKCEVAISQMIQRGALRPGQKISEVNLAGKLKMGLAPVRSALDRLAQMGLVQRLSRSGTFVTELTLSQYSDMLDVRANLEGLAVRLACSRVTDAKLDELMPLAEAFDKQNNEKRSGRNWFTRSVGLDLRFHLELANLSANSTLIQILNNQMLIEKAFLAALGVTPGIRNFPPDFPSHAAIIDAVRRRDAGAAEQLMVKHIIYGKEASIRSISGPGR